MKYIYECADCKMEYTEIREVTDPQFFTTCPCGKEYSLIREEEHE